MNAHIRIRQYPHREHGWLAWGIFFEGNKLPLMADEPDKEVVPAFATGITGELYRWETPSNQDGGHLVGKILRDMKKAGHNLIRESWTRGRLITFHQAQQEDHVDTFIVERMTEPGVWVRISEMRRDPLTGLYHETVNLTVRRGLPE